MKRPILMKHNRGWLAGELDEVGGWATITNKQGNKLYSGSATLLDKLFARGYLKYDEGYDQVFASLALGGE